MLRAKISGVEADAVFLWGKDWRLENMGIITIRVMSLALNLGDCASDVKNRLTLMKDVNEKCGHLIERLRQTGLGRRTV